MMSIVQIPIRFLFFLSLEPTIEVIHHTYMNGDKNCKVNVGVLHMFFNL